MALLCFFRGGTKKMRNESVEYGAVITNAQTAKRKFNRLKEFFNNARKVGEGPFFEEREKYVQYWKDIYKEMTIYARFECKILFNLVRMHCMSLQEFDLIMKPQFRQVEKELKKREKKSDDYSKMLSKAYDRFVTNLPRTKKFKVLKSELRKPEIKEKILEILLS